MMKLKYVQLLQNHWLFSYLTHTELELTASNLRQKTYKPGDYIFFQDDEPSKLYFIISGEISVEVVSINGHSTILATLFQNEIFGEFALIDSKPRSATTRARIMTEIAYLDKKHFLALMENNPQFSRRLASGLVARLRNSNQQIESLNTQSLKTRVLSALLDLCQGVNGAVVKLTQAQLAERVSASREKVNISLKAFERHGLISIKRGQIEIHDVTKMQERVTLEKSSH